MIRRREFIAGLGAVTACPRLVLAQQGEQARRIGLLDGLVENDRASQTFIARLREGLAKVGWVDGRNLRIDVRYGAGDADRIRAVVAELLGNRPELVVATSGNTIRALQQQTRTIPIVFAGGGDVAVNGIVKDIAHPEGNATGIANLFYSIGSKWLELLKDAVPSLERVAIIYDPRLTSDFAYHTVIETAAPALGVQTTRIPSHQALELVRAIDAFAVEPKGGLIIVPPAPPFETRKLINQLAAQHRLPTITGGPALAREGSLLSYGSVAREMVERVPFFVDRLLRGAKVSELPVEYPTKFELVINLKTAKALGLTVPQSILLRADEVIE